MNIRKKTVLITGATRGIGREIAKKLASENYNVILVSHSQEKLNETKRLIQEINPDCQIELKKADLTKETEIIALGEWAAEKEIDVLVNNVGLFEPFSILGEAPGTIQKLLTINYLTTHLLCQYIGKNMKRLRRGHIFNMSSTACVDPVKAGTYTVTKFAIHGLTKVLREELRDYQVKVTEIIPGSTLTSSWDGQGHDENSFVDPKDIANAVYHCLQIGETANIEEIIIKPQKGNILTDPIE